MGKAFGINRKTKRVCEISHHLISNLRLHLHCLLRLALGTRCWGVERRPCQGCAEAPGDTFSADSPAGGWGGGGEEKLWRELSCYSSPMFVIPSPHLFLWIPSLSFTPCFVQEDSGQIEAGPAAITVFHPASWH